MTEDNEIVLIVNAAIVRQNVARIADYLAGFGATLTVVTKVVQLSPQLIDRIGLAGCPLYDTDVRNCRTILQAGARLLCSQEKREQIGITGIPEEAQIEAYAETVKEISTLASGTGIPTVYLDIDEGRDGIRPEQFGRLASVLHASGRPKINVVCNVRCDADSQSPANFFMPLHASIIELERLGVSVAHASLGGSAVLPHVAQAAIPLGAVGKSVSVRVGESVLNGSVPHSDGPLHELDLRNALSVRLPILRKRSANLYLIAAGYSVLEQSSIAIDELTIRRQWSEHTLLECPDSSVVGDLVEIPLTYTGAARLKVHRDTKTIVVE